MAKQLAALVDEIPELEKRFTTMAGGIKVIFRDRQFNEWRGKVLYLLQKMSPDGFINNIVYYLNAMNGHNDEEFFSRAAGMLKAMSEDNPGQQQNDESNAEKKVDPDASDSAKTDAPKLFISYSHDDEAHKNWVLKLATDLRQHMGVDVILDQWDLRAGGDLGLFMEQGLSNAALVLCVCSEQYVKKADAGVRGAGYEKMIMVQPMLQNTNVDHIIPIVRNNSAENKMPRFLGTKLYVDFSDDKQYLSKLSELVSRIYNEDISKKPPLGVSPFSGEHATQIDLKNALEKTKYHSPALFGSVSFDYTNNSGNYTIGTGEYEFETQWSTCGYNSIHAYKDKVKAIGYIPGCSAFPSLEEIMNFDFTSRSRVVYEGEIVVWMNKYNHFAATKIIKVQCEEQGVAGNLSFDYRIYS